MRERGDPWVGSGERAGRELTGAGMRAVAGPDDAGGKKCDESEMLEVNLTVEIRLTGRPREAERAPEVGPGGCGATACGNGLRQLRRAEPRRC
jgi:hypothetical protein